MTRYLDVIGAAGSLSARVLLASLAGDVLSSRMELANAFVGIRGIREGLTLMELGLSPYHGAFCLLHPIPWMQVPL
jgi:hypothetical protein